MNGTGGETIGLASLRGSVPDPALTLPVKR